MGCVALFYFLTHQGIFEGWGGGGGVGDGGGCDALKWF